VNGESTKTENAISRIQKWARTKKRVKFFQRGGRREEGGRENLRGRLERLDND